MVRKYPGVTIRILAAGLWPGDGSGQDPRPAAHLRSRFPPGPRSIWKDAPEPLWNDWHWQQRERVTRLDQLEKVIRLTDDERRAVVESDAEFHISCFSFFSNKNLSVGEGGMVVARDRAIYERLRGLRSHGMTTLTLDRHQGRAVSYDVLAPGLNYRMDEIRAAIGLVQLANLEAGNKRRGDLTARYRSRFAGSAVRMPFTRQPAGAVSAYHILPVLLPEGCERLAVIEKLKVRGVQASIHYPPFWDFTGYRGSFRAEDTPVAARISERELTLPLWIP